MLIAKCDNCGKEAPVPVEWVDGRFVIGYNRKFHVRTTEDGHAVACSLTCAIALDKKVGRKTNDNEIATMSIMDRQGVVN